MFRIHSERETSFNVVVILVLMHAWRHGNVSSLLGGSAATSQLWDEFLDHAPDESVKNVRRCNRGKASEKKQVMTFIKQFTVNTSLIFERKLTDAQFFEGQHRAVRPQEFSIHFFKKNVSICMHTSIHVEAQRSSF